eukprot:273380_1
MFNYRNHSHFQTPSMKTSKPSRNENINTFNINNMKNNDNNQIFSTIKRSKINTNRRFGTNLTNKRPMKRMNSNNKINKESNQKFNSSSFQFNIGINNKLNTNTNTIPYIKHNIKAQFRTNPLQNDIEWIRQ